ncbi:MAG TPA: polyphosphate kinase 1 [Bacteroidia bacterium]|nr:polyphosphate kinase 1 [Bacteroidia bacterium]
MVEPLLLPSSSFPMGKRDFAFINRDLSWLLFNARVLQEAQDPMVPLLERLRFLGIFSNNRDEFFRVRIATIRRMIELGKKGKEILGENPKELLEKIQRIVLRQQEKFDKIYKSIRKELEEEKICIIDEGQLSSEQGVFVSKYFHEQVYPFLVPVMINSIPKFPYLKDKTLYLAVHLIPKEKKVKEQFALIEIPTDVVPRFLSLPVVNERHFIILLDDVIRYCLKDVFSIFPQYSIDAYAIKLTRDAELDIDSDISKSLMEKISRSVKQRKKGQPVRLVYDQTIYRPLLDFILKKMKFKVLESLVPGGRYHNFMDFINFPKVGRSELAYPLLEPFDHPAFVGESSTFKVIRKKDVLLNYPFHSFHHCIDMIREASIDPDVISIRMTLYRLAKNSSVVNALVNALRNGKQVIVVIEIQARFDEESNIYYANKLQEEGAEVIFGVPGLKVHSKLLLITRREGKKTVLYAQIGTGNFNEKTAKVYSDHSLFTCDKRITSELDTLFKFYSNNFKTGNYKHLIVSPFNTRKQFIQFIKKEIEQAKVGKQAWMVLKMNSLVDTEMVSWLYKASKAGVKIDLIIRGICALVPGVKGMSENIRAISIVDQFLEHSRVYIFCNSGQTKFYLSSGDWMYRNLDNRSEVAVPVYDQELQKDLWHYISMQLSDNVKARLVNTKNDNLYVTPEKDSPAFRSQLKISQWLRSRAGVEQQNAGLNSELELHY